MWEILQTIYHIIFDPIEGQYVTAIAPVVGAALISAVGYIVSSAISAYGQEEYEQPQQMAGSLFQPTQPPQLPPFQPMGLPQQPDYQTPPAITQFPPFQPLFGKRRGQ